MNILVPRCTFSEYIIFKFCGFCTPNFTTCIAYCIVTYCDKILFSFLEVNLNFEIEKLKLTVYIAFANHTTKF